MRERYLFNLAMEDHRVNSPKNTSIHDEGKAAVLGILQHL